MTTKAKKDTRAREMNPHKVLETKDPPGNYIDSDYQFIAQAWVESENTPQNQELTERLYKIHLQRKKANYPEFNKSLPGIPRFVSKRIRQILRDAETAEKYPSNLDVKEVIFQGVRNIFKEKKNIKPLSLNDLQDFCKLYSKEQLTPNDLFHIDKHTGRVNPVSTYSSTNALSQIIAIYTKEDIESLRTVCSRMLTDDNTRAQFPCFFFPLLGLVVIVSFVKESKTEVDSFLFGYPSNIAVYYSVRENHECIADCEEAFFEPPDKEVEMQCDELNSYDAIHDYLLDIIMTRLSYRKNNGHIANILDKFSLTSKAIDQFYERDQVWTSGRAFSPKAEETSQKAETIQQRITAAEQNTPPIEPGRGNE